MGRRKKRKKKMKTNMETKMRRGRGKKEALLEINTGP